MKFAAYLFFDRDCDWECYITTDPREFDGVPEVYLGGGVNTLTEVFDLMMEHGFDAEYYYLFVERCMSHYIYNLLNK